MEHHELDARNAVPATPRRQTASSSKQPTLKPPEFAYTSPTPDSPPGHSKRAPSEPSQSALKVPSTETPTRKCSTSTGKRKADDVEGTPPDMKEKRTSFAPDPDVRSHRASATSNSSRAPSSYHRKRARLSTTSPVQTPTRPANTGSCSSRTSNTPAPLPQVPPRAVSRATSNRSAVTQGNPKPNPHPKGPRRSMSAASIPLSALISPHAPSISRSSTFHMRDPRRPPKKRTTGWALKLRTEEEAASPTHAWMFFLGFLVFPLWWVASFWRIPITRKVGGGIDEEKAVTLDDPQVEFDARSWRKRCRVMSCVAFVTYVPFIVLVAVFVR